MIPAACFSCGQEFQDMPPGFIYDDPAAGWHQDITEPRNYPITGYCKLCADGIAAADQDDRQSGKHDLRTLEDEAGRQGR